MFYKVDSGDFFDTFEELRTYFHSNAENLEELEKEVNCDGMHYHTIKVILEEEDTAREIKVKTYNSNADVWVGDMCISVSNEGFNEWPENDNMDDVIYQIEDETPLSSVESGRIRELLGTWVNVHSGGVE